jgi:hypothetical protein
MITVRMRPTGRTMTMEAQGLSEYILHAPIVSLDVQGRDVVIEQRATPADPVLSMDQKIAWVSQNLGVNMGCCI